MPIAIAGLYALALAYAGVTALSLTHNGYQRRIWGRSASAWTVIALHLGGWGLVALALVPCVLSWEEGLALIIWFGILSCAATTQLLLMPNLPRVAARFAIIAGGIGLVGLSIITWI